MQTTSNNSRGSAHLRGAVRFWSIPAAMLIAGCVGILSVPAAAQDVAAPTKAKPVRTKSVSKTTDKSAEGDVDGQAAATPKKRDPADAQRTLDSGIKLLQAGKAEQAIQSFTVVIAGGNLPAPIMAKALHQRGAAYRVTAKPALALSDLTSALWLKNGLTDTDRADAIQQRSAAYREAGLPDQTDADGKPVGTSATRRASAMPAAAGSGATVAATSAASTVATASLAPDTAPTQAASSGTPLGNLFTNLFGGGTPAAAAAAPASRASTPSSVAAASPPAATSGWSLATAVAAPRVKTASATATAVAAPVAQAVTPVATPAKAVADSGVHARMIVKSEADGTTLAARLKKDFSAQLAGRSASVSQAQFGGMGSFYQVRVGPYTTPAEAQDFCKRVKSAGADCVAVNQ